MKPRRLWFGAIALLALALLSLFAAPQNTLQSGSTYSRAPDGYGAWYASLQQQQIPIQRWQRPYSDLTDPGSTDSRSTDPSPQPPVPSRITLLRINPNLTHLRIATDERWIRRGNVEVILGVKEPVTQAPFRSRLAGVTIETSRRRSRAQLQESRSRQRLGDSYGAVVWEETIGAGKIIYAVTPFLAANAYQREPENFKFLTNLVTEPGLPLWVDEYLHGYKDPQVVQRENSDHWIAYLAKTPLALLAVQAIAILLVLIWEKNRRFGPPLPPAVPPQDSSSAYIHALGSVLHKAEYSEFVVKTIGQAEQRYAQRSLGLGDTPVEAEALIQAWTQQTGRPAEEMAAVLRTKDRDRRISERDLLIWLRQLQTLRRHLP